MKKKRIGSNCILSITTVYTKTGKTFLYCPHVPHKYFITINIPGDISIEFHMCNKCYKKHKILKDLK